MVKSIQQRTSKKAFTVKISAFSCLGWLAKVGFPILRSFMNLVSDSDCWWFRNPVNQLGLIVYPMIYGVLYIPGGWEWDFWNHQPGVQHSFQPLALCSLSPWILAPWLRSMWIALVHRGSHLWCAPASGGEIWGKPKSSMMQKLLSLRN